MELPVWVEEEIRKTKEIITGHILIEFWDSGVIKVDILSRRLPPKVGIERPKTRNSI